MIFFADFLYSIINDEYKNLLTVINNDIMIGNTKIGPTFYCGKNGGMLTLIRLKNSNNLDKIFKGDKNHESRKSNKRNPIGSLDQFCDLSREQIIDAFYKFKDKIKEGTIIDSNRPKNEIPIQEVTTWNGLQQQMK